MGEQRLIDANAIRYGYTARLLSEFKGDPLDGGYVIFRDKLFASKESIDKLPTIDPVKHGHWVFDKEVSYLWLCSQCGKSPSINGNGTGIGYIQRESELFGWCPHCGARMGKEDGLDEAETD